MTTNEESKLDVETQRRIEYTRQKMMRIEQINEQLRKIRKSNKEGEQKLERLLKRKESLEADTKRLMESSLKNEMEVGTDILNSFEDPMELEMICAEEFNHKMSQLQKLLNEIIVRTCFNEKAMCTEIGHQESEFESRLHEMIQSRNNLTNRQKECIKNCEQLAFEQAELYEVVRKMEENLEKFDASKWLLNVESRRVSDLLDRSKREPKLAREVKRPVLAEPITVTKNDILSSSASLSHEHSDYSIISKSNSYYKKAGDLKKEAKKECPVHKNAEYTVSIKSKSFVSGPISKNDSKKPCPVHGNLVKSENFENLQIKGIDLMKLISKAIADEFK